VCWEAVPNTLPGNSKAPVAKCVVCAWNSARSVGGRAEPASRTFRDQVYVVGQVRRCLAGRRQEDKPCQFEVYTSLEPVQLTQNWRDLFPYALAMRQNATLLVPSSLMQRTLLSVHFHRYQPAYLSPVTTCRSRSASLCSKVPVVPLSHPRGGGIFRRESLRGKERVLSNVPAFTAEIQTIDKTHTLSDHLL